MGEHEHEHDDEGIVIDCDELTDAAFADFEAFLMKYDDGACYCHISPPCGYCTHPGNPINLVEDETAWRDNCSPKSEPEAKPDVMDLTKKFLG